MPNVVHPDHGYPHREDEFRRQVRELLNLTGDVRDAQILAALRRVVDVDKQLTANQERQRRLAAEPVGPLSL